MRPDEVEILEDLIVAAHNDAKAKVEAAMQEKTRADLGPATAAGHEAAVLNDGLLSRRRAP